MTEPARNEGGKKGRLSFYSIVMGATLLSRILGFIRQAMVNAFFGASGSADVLNAVFNIPNNLRKLLAEGALSSAFIPVLSQSLEDIEQKNTLVPQQVVRNVLTFQAIVLIPLLVLSVVFARPITGFILDFPEVERQLLAADLFKWLIHYTLLISVSAVLMGSLNSSNHFTFPALTPIVFSLMVIASLLLLHRRMGIYSMVVGVLAGGVAQVLFQSPEFLRSGFSFKPLFSFRNPQFRRILRAWLPVLASSSIFVVNQQVAVFFASGLEDGSTSAILNAVVFWQLPIGIFGASITTVLFPRLSREALDSDSERFRSTVAYGLRGLLAFLVPSAIILGGLSYEAITVVLQRGRFTEQNTILAAQVLMGYCLGMPSVGIFNFLQRSFYARNDYRTPVLTALVILVIDVALSLVLKETRLRVAGLSVANSVAFTVGALLLLIASRRALGGLDGRTIFVSLAKIALACAPALTGAILFRLHLGDLWQSFAPLENLGMLAAAGVIGLLVTALLYWLLRIEVVAILLKRRVR